MAPDIERKLADEIAGEFSWEVEMALKELRSVGFAPEVERFSELSGGIVAQKPVRSPSR